MFLKNMIFLYSLPWKLVMFCSILWNPPPLFCNHLSKNNLAKIISPSSSFFDLIKFRTSLIFFLCCYPHRFLSKVCEIVTVFPLETHAILENKNTIPNLEMLSGSGSLSLSTVFLLLVFVPFFLEFFFWDADISYLEFYYSSLRRYGFDQQLFS